MGNNDHEFSGRSRDFIYEILSPYYPVVGRPPVDPVSMFKMLLVGYLYGIKSKRRLMEEIQLNIAYRWFADLNWEMPSQITRHLAKPECGNGSKATYSRRSSIKL